MCVCVFLVLEQMQSAPGFVGEGSGDKWAKRPLEERVDSKALFLLMRAHCHVGIADWRSRLLARNPPAEAP